MTTVFLLDDHEIVRRGLRDLLEANGLEVVGEAATAEEARQRIPATQPDVAVLDVRLPDGNGVDVCRDVRSANPNLQCLMLTSFSDDEALFDAIMAGEAPGAPAADPLPSLRVLRLGLPLRYFHDGADPEVTAVMQDTVHRLREAGVVLVEAEVPGLKELNEAVGFPVALYELQQDLPAYLEAAGYPMTLAEVAAGIGSPDVAGVVGSQLGDDAVTREAYEAALAARVRLQASYAAYFADNRLEAMVFPTAILPARPIGEDLTVELNGAQVPTFFTFIRNTDPGSNAGIPGISLPAGLTSTRLPVGVELDGPAGSDRRLLALAAAIEAVLPPLPVPPPS